MEKMVASVGMLKYWPVTTIPPIYERSTASNISFAKGEEVKVSESCNPLLKASSASRGVRLKQSDAPTVFGTTPMANAPSTDMVFGVTPTKAPDSACARGGSKRSLSPEAGPIFGTTPLLSPTMEKEFLMNSWATQLFDNPKMRVSGVEEVNSVFPIWEEDYQDLSGWCMDPFQARCDFPIGEFETNRSSDTNDEVNGVSIKKTVVNAKDSGDFLGEEEVSLGKSSPTIMEFAVVEANINSQVGLQHVIKPEVVEPTAVALADVLLIPTESSIAPRTDDIIALVAGNETNEALTNVQLQSANHQNNIAISNEYVSPITYDLPKAEKNNWDTINTLEAPETDSFDLLSYLCDDNIQSPSSSVSRDSGPTIESISSVASPIESSTTRQLRNSRRNKIASKSYVEASTSSSSIAAISAALDSVSKMSRRSSRAHKRADSSNRNDDEGLGRGKKRCIDSESEDRMSDCSYRESREKNNEASRKSRMNKKQKENEMMARAGELEKDNRILKMKVEELEKLVTSMRTTILRAALKKRF